MICVHGGAAIDRLVPAYPIHTFNEQAGLWIATLKEQGERELISMCSL